MRQCIVAVALVALAGCSRTDSAPPPDTAELQAARTAVQQRMNGYGEELRRGDVAGVLGYWAADARSEQVALEVVGSEVTQWAREFFPANDIAAFAATSNAVDAHDGGAVVYQWGNYTESVQPRDSLAAPFINHVNFVARWIRNDQGEWQIHRFSAVPMPRSPRLVTTAAKAADAPVGSLDPRVATEQLLERLAEYGDALRSNRAPAILDFWTDDGQLIEPGLHLLGKNELTRQMTQRLDAEQITRLELTSREIFIHDRGTIAYQYGRSSETVEPKDGSTPPSTAHTNFLARWRRGSDGLWRLDSMVSVPRPPA
jgi:ketosteroid isomerase-like protein